MFAWLPAPLPPGVCVLLTGAAPPDSVDDVTAERDAARALAAAKSVNSFHAAALRLQADAAADAAVAALALARASPLLGALRRQRPRPLRLPLPPLRAASARALLAALLLRHTGQRPTVGQMERVLRRSQARQPLWLLAAAQTCGRLSLCSRHANEAVTAAASSNASRAATAATAAATAAATPAGKAAAKVAATADKAAAMASSAARRHMQGKVLDSAELSALRAAAALQEPEPEQEQEEEQEEEHLGLSEAQEQAQETYQAQAAANWAALTTARRSLEARTAATLQLTAQRRAAAMDAAARSTGGVYHYSAPRPHAETARQKAAHGPNPYPRAKDHAIKGALAEPLARKLSTMRSDEAVLIEANVSAVQLAANSTAPKSAAATPTGGAALAEAVERHALPLALKLLAYLCVSQHGLGLSEYHAYALLAPELPRAGRGAIWILALHHLSLFVPPAARGAWSLPHTAQAKGLACLLMHETGTSLAGEMHARLGDYFLKRIGLGRSSTPPPPVVVVVVVPPPLVDGDGDGAVLVSAGGGAVDSGWTGVGPDRRCPPEGSDGGGDGGSSGGGGGSGGSGGRYASGARREESTHLRSSGLSGMVQSVHSVALPKLNFPAGQKLQSSVLSPALYFPASHAVHWPALALA